MELSLFARRFGGDSGVVDLMRDLGEAVSIHPDMIMMGGGNPGSRAGRGAALPQAPAAHSWTTPRSRTRCSACTSRPGATSAFARRWRGMLRAECGWEVGPQNIAVANGSQSAFFVLFNLFAGEFDGGRRKHILLPLVPEYIGYREVGLSDGMFHAERPAIERLPEQLFKYRVDFERLAPDAATGAICVSRPTNPTGNVLGDAEIARLDALARAHGIPLIIDGAYGTPFPHMLFTDATPHWNDNTVVVLSLSKLGLPGLRTGIVVAREEIVAAFARANTILSLACGNTGPALATALLDHGELLRTGPRAHRARSTATRPRARSMALRHEIAGSALPHPQARGRDVPVAVVRGHSRWQPCVVPAPEAARRAGRARA